MSPAARPKVLHERCSLSTFTRVCVFGNFQFRLGWKGDSGIKGLGGYYILERGCDAPCYGIIRNRRNFQETVARITVLSC